MSSVRCRTYDRLGWHDNASTAFAGKAVRILETRLLRCLRLGSRSPLIRGAERSIAFESSVYRSGSIGRGFADALSERARAAVKLPLLLDWLGSSTLDAAQLAAMKAPGVNVQRFHAAVWYRLDRVNNRTCRKVLVVDGKVGFTGGVGIADAWARPAQDPGHDVAKSKATRYSEWQPRSVVAKLIEHTASLL